MKFKILLFIIFQGATCASGQDRIFSFLAKYESQEQVKHFADSLNKPLLVTPDRIYAIGSDCLTRLFDGSVNDRDEDGDSNDRDKDGNINERSKGGGVAYRKKKGSSNDRKKNGDSNDRNEDGDVNDRNKGAGSDDRDAGGGVADGPRCSYNKRGKILLYTRQDIKSSTAQIFYNNQYFTNKHFKIIKL